MIADQAVLVMRTLADPTRLSIYERIVSARETTVAELTDHAGVSQPAVSQHVRALQEARLIIGRREGRNTFYRAEPRGLAPLSQWVRRYERIWEKRLDRLEQHLRKR